MARPERGRAPSVARVRAGGPRSQRGAGAVVAILLAAGCAVTPTDRAALSGPPALEPTGAVELVGRARGPLRGIGGSADLHVVLRADGSLWASIRQQPEEGPPVHEVLIWAPDVALLFDRRTLKSTELGEAPGEIEVWGARLLPSDALWLLGGRRAVDDADPMQWERRQGQWRGRRSEFGVRRPMVEPMSWSEAVWRDGAGSIHELRVEAEAFRDLPDGQRWPSRLAAEGGDLQARVVVEWDLVRWHEAMGDSILDPLWEPRWEPERP